MTELGPSGSTPAGEGTSLEQPQRFTRQRPSCRPTAATVLSPTAVRRPSPFRQCKLPVSCHLCRHPEDAAERKQITSRLPASDKRRVSSTKQQCPLICCWSTGEEEPSAESTSLGAEGFCIDSPLSSLPFHYKWTTKQRPHRRGGLSAGSPKRKEQTRRRPCELVGGRRKTTCRSSKGKKKITPLLPWFCAAKGSFTEGDFPLLHSNSGLSK